MVLALALPRDYPHRELLVTMTFGVVILSILVQGLSMGTLLRKLGLVSSHPEREDYERERGMMRAKAAALATLDGLLADGAVARDVVERLRAEYAGAIADAEQRIRDLHLQADALRSEEELTTRRHLLLVEKDSIRLALHKGYLGQEAHDLLIQDVDSRLLQLESDPE